MKIGTVVSVLTVILVTLKLTGNIDWTWWEVVRPILTYVGLSILITILLIIFKLK